MAFDPNSNYSGTFRNPMSNVNTSDLPDLCQNEESFDFSSYMNGSGNLEFCNDDLLHSFFTGKDSKQEEDSEVESCFHPSEPNSACASACSSAATSPVAFNFYNTPPVTPRSDYLRPASPSHQQFDGNTNPMANARYAQFREEDGSASNRYCSVRQHQVEPPNVVFNEASQPINVKLEPDIAEAMQPPQVINIKKEQISSRQRQLMDGDESEKSTHSLQQPTKRSASSNYKSPAKKSRNLLKGSEEYFMKRQRNNVAVRRSRDKAKLKAQETQKKVDELSDENDKLHARVAELSGELNTLKNLLKSLPHASA